MVPLYTVTIRDVAHGPSPAMLTTLERVEYVKVGWPCTPWQNISKDLKMREGCTTHLPETEHKSLCGPAVANVSRLLFCNCCMILYKFAAFAEQIPFLPHPLLPTCPATHRAVVPPSRYAEGNKKTCQQFVRSDYCSGVRELALVTRVRFDLHLWLLGATPQICGYWNLMAFILFLTCSSAIPSDRRRNDNTTRLTASRCVCLWSQYPCFERSLKLELERGNKVPPNSRHRLSDGTWLIQSK